jgi:uncharacterized membrane protein
MLQTKKGELIKVDPLTDLHGMIVHFPIALLFVSVGLEAAALYPRLRPHLNMAAFVTLLLGTIGAAAAVFTGPEENAPGVTRLMHTHENWAHLTLIVFGVLSVWRLWSLWRRKEHAGIAAVAFVALGAVGLGMLGYTGWLGGQMVYQEGVGVQRNGTPVAPPVHRTPGQGGPNQGG